MDFLKKFNTETQYDLAKDDFEWATVSLLKDVDEVRYMNKQEYYSKQYLTFEALEDGTFTFRFQGMHVNESYFGTFSYSLDNGNTWSTHNIIDEYYGLDIGDEEDFSLYITTPTVSAGGKVLVKGYNNSFYQDVVSITSTCRFNVSGNVYTLMRGENNPDPDYFTGEYTYRQIFKGCTTLISAENLYLPPIVNGSPSYIYASMFNGCTNLITAPLLLSTTLTDSCYNGMFQECRSLTAAPELPATTLASNCYYGMFGFCTSLTTAPELPATTLANSCYSQMFRNCTALTTAPELPATTLVSNCYSSMFQRCTRLNYIKAMFTTTPSTTYTNNWVNGVAATGTFVKNSSATWNVTGVSGIPSGWTVQTASE